MRALETTEHCVRRDHALAIPIPCLPVLCLVLSLGCGRPSHRSSVASLPQSVREPSSVLVMGTFPGMRPVCDSLDALYADLPPSMKWADPVMLENHVCGASRTGCCFNINWTWSPSMTTSTPPDRLRDWLQRAGWRDVETECFADGPGVSQSALVRGDLYCLISETGGFSDLEDTTRHYNRFITICIAPRDSVHER